jgi:hypothetical protein
VRADPAKKRPLGFQSTICGSSSNAVESTVGVPPLAGIVAMTLLV